MSRISFLFILLFTATTIFAQQAPMSNFYSFNEYLLNPAEAGRNNRLYGSTSQRIQWRGIEGAPITTFAGFHGGINEKMGLGAKVMIDQTDILQQFSASASYAYRIQINGKARLNFGVSAMALQNSINYGDAVVGDYADDVLAGSDQDGMAFDAEAGILLEYRKFKFGLASNNLFESGVNYDLPDNRGTATFERIRKFSAYSSYQFTLSDDWSLEPFILVENQGEKTFQYEVSALSCFKETFYLGTGYRQEAGYIVRTAFQITDIILAGYAYEFSNSGISSYSSGSHEFMIALKVGVKKNEGIKERSNEITEAPLIIESKKGKNPEKELVEKKMPESKKEEAEPIPSKKIEAAPEVEKVIAPVLEQTKQKEEEKIINRELLKQKVQFEFEKTELTEKAKDVLNQIANELKEFPSEVITVFGYTCDMGSDQVNIQYSNQRADIVKQYLIKKGVRVNQVKTKAMLDTQPLVPNNSIENRQKNRRVEFKLNK